MWLSLIHIYVSSEETVSLSEDDFQSFFADEYTNGDLEYVKFTVGDATNYGTSSYGYLYESDAAKASKVSGSTKFYYEAESRQDDLDAVVFTAGTRTNAYTVKIPFTATGDVYKRQGVCCGRCVKIAEATPHNCVGALRRIFSANSAV